MIKLTLKKKEINQYIFQEYMNLFYSTEHFRNSLTCYTSVDSLEPIFAFYRVLHNYVEFHFYSIQDFLPYLERECNIKKYVCFSSKRKEIRGKVILTVKWKSFKF